MPHNDLVTVIMPVYRGERSILTAVASALTQTHERLEIIVVDDGSTDNTWALLETITNPRVRIIRQANAGAAAARNHALSYAQGQYIAFLDADDAWLPDKIMNELMTLETASAPVGIAYSRYYAVDDDGNVFHRSPPVAFAGNVFADLTAGLAFIIPSASLFHRAIFEDLGGFPTARRIHEDFAFILRAVKKYPAFPTGQYDVLYRQSLRGKGRAIMRDYDAAVAAALGIVDEIRDILTPNEAERLRRNQLHALYFRFLMYGFDDHARQLKDQINVDALCNGTGTKGRIGWIFAKTGVNLMRPARLATQLITERYFRYRLHGITQQPQTQVPKHRNDIRVREPLAH